MRVALVICPSWIIENPPLSISILASTLKSQNQDVKCFDLNIRFYNYIYSKQNTNYREENNIDIYSWQNNKNQVWENQQKVNQLFYKYNDEIESYILDILSFKPNIIGFTVYSISMFFTIEFVKRIKQKNSKVKIVFGGPACFPHYRGKILFLYSQFVDFICFGEGEVAMLNLVNALEKGEGISTLDGFYHRHENGDIYAGKPLPNITEMDSIPFADFSDFNLDDYRSKTISINTSRGCINRCAFCNESPFWKKFRIRSARNVYEEIVQLKHQFPLIEKLWFSDSLINGDLMFLNELCDLMIAQNLNVKWTASAYVREGMSYDLFLKMKKSGCEALLFGLESGSDDVLNKMNKGYSSKIAKKVLIDSVIANITTYTNLIIGHPGESINSYLQTVRFLMFFLNPNGIKNTTFNTCLVLNGSALKGNLSKYKIIHGFVDSWYSNDLTNNRDIREIRLDLIRKMSIYKHYNSGNILNNISVFFKRNLIAQCIIYLFYFEFYLRVKSFFINRNFKKKHKEFFYDYSNVSFIDDDNTMFTISQQRKIEIIINNMIEKSYCNENDLRKEEIFSKIQNNLTKLFSYFDKNQIDSVIDNLFPMDKKQLMVLLNVREEADVEILSYLIKAQLSMMPIFYSK